MAYKIILNSTELQSALAKIKSSVGNGRPNPNSDNIYFTAKDGYILLQASNLFVENETKLYDINIKENSFGSFAVKGKTFCQFIDKIPCGNVELKFTEKNVEISTNTMKVKVGIITDCPMPNPIQIEGFAEVGTVAFEEFKRCVNAVICCSEQSDTRPVLSGLCFHSKGGEVSVVGCSMVKLAITTMTFKNKSQTEDFQYIVPATALSTIIGIAGLYEADKNDITFKQANGRSAVFSVGDTDIRVRLITDKFLDYEKVFPTATKSIKVDAVDMKDAIETVQLAISDIKGGAVVMDIEGHSAKFTANSTAAECETNVNFPYSDGFTAEYKIGFNPIHMVALLKSFGDKEITMKFAGELQGMTLITENIKALLLPVRLKK